MLFQRTGVQVPAPTQQLHTVERILCPPNTAQVLLMAQVLSELKAWPLVPVCQLLCNGTSLQAPPAAAQQQSSHCCLGSSGQSVLGAAPAIL